MSSLIEALETASKDADGRTDGRHTMSVMSPIEGDYKLTWDPESKTEVDAARKSFDDLRAKGMVAYSVGKKGKKGKVLTEFDPDAEAMILAPALAGG